MKDNVFSFMRHMFCASQVTRKPLRPWLSKNAKPYSRTSYGSSKAEHLISMNALAFRDFDGEFDPGSGRTLAACLIHASRTLSTFGSHERVANGCVTREKPAPKTGIARGNSD